MARYLLGTQCLMDVALLNDGAAHRWFSGRSAQPGLFVGDVAISAFSVAAIRAFFRQRPPTSVETKQHESNLGRLIRQFEVADAVEGASPAAVFFWDSQAQVALTYDVPGHGQRALGFEEKFVLATALKGNHGRGFILVDRAQAVHHALGVTVYDPYAAPGP